jgi:rhodanese-related sulfurtransferase
MPDAIAPARLSEQIASGDAPLVLDVRSKREFDEGHVPGAVHLPFWQAGSRAKALKRLIDAPVVVYCGHGPRAYIAGSALRRQGFSKVVYLTGHMKRWKELGLPLERT